ncbi:MAG TPA: GNAT family N-acetyltransferase [Blastocatellia bacterium]|nr:GNAT family N-acetyltransferase [Blastocatellia bacterium]
MEESYEIRPARLDELPLIQEIEQAASTLFLDTDYSFLIDFETMSIDVLRERQSEGLVWVACGRGREPVGFAVAKVIDGAAHLDELDVHPSHGRRGLGRMLTLAVCEWARAAGYKAVTLSTFRDIPWNRPFYERLGFRQLAEEELGPGLRQVRAREAAIGLPLESRVCMRRDL